MRLLIVEDEAKTRAYLSQGMQEAGFIVDAAPDGGAGRELLRLHCYDVVILDVRLPIILPQAETLGVTDPELDLTRHRAARCGRTLELTPKELALLTLLMRHHGELLSRTLIACTVWDINFDSDTNLVDVSVGRLRRKVDGESQLELIHTLRGVGYVLEER